MPVCMWCFVILILRFVINGIYNACCVTQFVKCYVLLESNRLYLLNERNRTIVRTEVTDRNCQFICSMNVNNEKKRVNDLYIFKQMCEHWRRCCSISSIHID